MMNHRRTSLPLLAVVVSAGLVACGGDDGGAEISLSPLAEEGRSLARSQGCAACHGTSGEGNVGPAFVGLWGSSVPIVGQDDPVLADEAYVRESITDPAAKRVEGYNLPMPTNDLSDDELDALVAYIRELGATAPTIYASKGCASCHGGNGEGGTGGPLAGLWGSTFELADGSTATADRDYVAEAITDPDASRPAANNRPMPSVELTDDELQSLVDYIERLGDVTP